MEGITLDSGHLEGMYTDGGLEITGGVQLTLGKWVSSSIGRATTSPREAGLLRATSTRQSQSR